MVGADALGVDSSGGIALCTHPTVAARLSGRLISGLPVVA